MMTRSRRRREAQRIGWIKAGLIMGGLLASVLGAQILTLQETAGTPDNTGPGSTVQAAPDTARATQFTPVTRSRSS